MESTLTIRILTALVLMCLRGGALIRPPLYRETLVSQTANVSFPVCKMTIYIRKVFGISIIIIWYVVILKTRQHQDFNYLVILC